MMHEGGKDLLHFKQSNGYDALVQLAKSGVSPSVKLDYNGTPNRLFLPTDNGTQEINITRFNPSMSGVFPLEPETIYAIKLGDLINITVGGGTRFGVNCHYEADGHHYAFQLGYGPLGNYDLFENGGGTVGRPQHPDISHTIEVSDPKVSRRQFAYFVLPAHEDDDPYILIADGNSANKTVLTGTGRQDVIIFQ